MHFKKRYIYVLIFVSMLLLTGSSRFSCSSDDSDNKNSSGGDTEIRVTVGNEQKISAGSGGFNGNLDDGDQFGSAIADPGDLEADGVSDLAVGAPFNDDDGNDEGAVWILFMDDDGRVDQKQKISSNAGSFGGNLEDEDLFGSAVAGTGDLNSDGAFDLAVGVPGDDKGGDDRGGVWILFLDAEGKVRDEQKIADDTGGFGGNLDDDDRFGSAVADIGDVNGDGIPDLAVGTPNNDDGSDNAGAVWILFMKVDGKVEAWQKISMDAGRFDGNLEADDHFGAALAGIGDLDNNGIPDLAVGVPGDDEGGEDRGSVWILFLDAEGKVLQEQKIADDTGDFKGQIDDDDRFGSAVAAIGDMNGDGIPDLAAGAPNDDDGADNAGAFWILMMQADGRVDGWQKVSESAGGFDGNLDADDHFGAAITGIGNLDNSELTDLAVGAPGDDGDGDDGADQGAVWILFMERKI
jgi:hypothetical protein